MAHITNKPMVVPKLEFTHEVEKCEVLNFLEVEFISENNNIIFEWYQKPNLSGHFLNYESHHPLKQKILQVYTLTDKVMLFSTNRLDGNNFIHIRMQL